MVTSSLLCTRPLRVSSTLPCEWPVQGRQECGPSGAEVRAAWAQVTLTRRLLGAGCWRYWLGLGWSSGIRVMLLSGRVRTGLDLPLTCQITLHRSWPFSGPQFPHVWVGVWAGADEHSMFLCCTLLSPSPWKDRKTESQRRQGSTPPCSKVPNQEMNEAEIQSYIQLIHPGWWWPGL